ncbi:hypothetical protein [Nocardia sp. NBC_01388]|uniref:hypothetical protein n=1 Tax=Nocardia sp. NBC_01388 TaxID=2903596 RepID=UPI0032440488
MRRTALRAPGERNIYPADSVLSLPRGRHSHGLRRQAVLEAVDTYWAYHLAHEHQRTYPDDHRLAA